MTLFHQAVEKRIDDPRGRLARLLKCECKRDDQTLCTRTTNYELSICQEDTSGKTWKSIVEYRKEIKAWPIIASGNVERYQRFYN